MIYIYIYLILIAVCSLFVILCRNPIQSVLFLMLVYILTSMIFFWIGAEFMAFIILIVYVGAISILFLFVVMMLDLRIVELYSTFFNYLPIGSFIGVLFFFEIFCLILYDFSLYNLYFLDNLNTIFSDLIIPKTNLILFGELLYNYFGFLIILMGLILLIAILGSIVLTIDFNEKSIKITRDAFFSIVKSNIYNISFWSKSKNIN